MSLLSVHYSSRLLSFLFKAITATIVGFGFSSMPASHLSPPEPGLESLFLLRPHFASVYLSLLS
ncbi:hypothetical protein QL093DRAFT_2327597 [Fusarium oxysporum]|nr:hypothetical protein QL093DRAFT_2327597 [Fusarium oxysporum]